ncbi:hypothetical protein [Microterricola viridarii]|uniref:Amidohydrolase n=1 Tax=Microterricola viridarii TaxID=412690 RepID=A0A0Y0Q9I4_9MICO|nr:hypothetical protein [Microterricola viridarii]AMB60176.1 hypothetical protein AWU67_16405 [Microterricola viridarii]
MTPGTRHLGVQQWWSGGWRGAAVFALQGGLLHPLPDFDRATTPVDLELPGTLFPQLTDQHVHLGLGRPELLLPGGITHVVDLGWRPAEATGWLAASAQPGSTLPAVRIAGAFLSCAGGYPSSSGWAPAGSTVELATDAAETGQAADAVAAQLAAGASVIKLMFNSAAGPVPGDGVAAAVVAAARAHGVPVVAHTEGAGQAARALDAGVSALAHTPFTEALDDALLRRMAVAGLSWISTLDIHGWGAATPERAIAIDNVRRFTAVGGRVLYGTDLGNGPLPNGVNERELLALAEAGLTPDALVASIAGAEHAPLSAAQPAIGPRVAWVPGTPPATGYSADTARWLAGARGTTTAHLEETLP